MTNSVQQGSWISKIRWGGASAALTLAVLLGLGLVATQSGQAQTFTSLYSFSGSPDGATPYAGVISDKSGTLYGTTEVGGSSNYGTVYSFSGGTATVLHSFTGSDGSYPFAALVMNKSGTLYGTTTTGGASGYGTVFALNSSGLTTLYSFTGGTDGSGPYSGLVLDKKGNLYGTTYTGGSSGYGTVFKVNIKTKKETVLHSFTGAPDGQYPIYGNLAKRRCCTTSEATLRTGHAPWRVCFEMVQEICTGLLRVAALPTTGRFSSWIRVEKRPCCTILEGGTGPIRKQV